MIVGQMPASSKVLRLQSKRAVVEVAPEVGGSVLSFSHEIEGKRFDWLRAGSPDDLSSDRMACFPLIPYSNRVRDGRFTFGGRQVALEADPVLDPNFEHGHGWRRPWKPTAISETEILLRYEHAADAWPWPYVAEQRIALEADALAVTVTLSNLSDEPMPCGLGLHPYFPRDPETLLTARVAGMWSADDAVLPVAHGPCRGPADPAAGMRVSSVFLDNVFTGWDGEALIRWPERRASMTIVADQPLRTLVLYTPAGEDYFCAEPVSNVTDAFNLAASGGQNTGVISLDPGADVSAKIRFIPRFDAPN